MDDYRYLIVPTTRFKKAMKTIMKRKTCNTIELKNIIEELAKGKTLPAKYKDHQLSIDGRKYGKYPVRECHIQNDFLLIYRKAEDEGLLLLIDIGSHSDLFR